MSLADEIKKLEDLRWNGTLTDEEFARAKAALIAKLEDDSEPAHKGEAAGTVAAQLAEVRYQNELERMDREWASEKENFMVAGKYGQRYLPSRPMGIGISVVGGLFGLLWTIMAFSITRGAPDFAPFSVAKVIFPLVGIGVTIGAVVMGLYTVKKAEAYQRALAAYQQRRAALKPERADNRS